MSIKIISEPDIYLTQEQINQYKSEYEKAFQFYSGTPTPFETWVSRRLAVEMRMNTQDTSHD